MTRFPPERLVCLTEETVETLYLMGEEARIVGVSGYCVRPARVRREKPRISAFTSADIPKICALKPDLVLAFSDLQADIVAELVRKGLAVHCFNQRDIAGILAMIGTLGALIGEGEKATTLIATLSKRLDDARGGAEKLKRRPRVYFEEWDDPIITGIGWVSELIGLAGGVECFPDCAGKPSAKDRIIATEAVVTAEPDIVIASWCGKKFSREKFVARPGYDAIPAVRDGELHEIKSPLILQPGPAALTDGLDAIRRIIADWESRNG